METPSLTDFCINNVVVRPVRSEEKARWKELMATHHYLGFPGAGGRSVFYVATYDGEWIALLCWASAALHVGAREDWIGWNGEVQRRRLKHIANNTRFLLLPGFSIKNLASKILSLSLKRLSADWQTFFGYSIWLAETFVDPSRYKGTCYFAANWQLIGKTRGFSRVPVKEGFYRDNGQPKLYLAFLLLKGAKEKLASERFIDKRKGEFQVIDLRKLPIDGKNGLIQTLRTMQDARRRQGKVHTNTTVLAISACAMLSGARSFKAISEWSSRLSPSQLKRLRSRSNKPPSESTIQRVLRKTSAQDFDNKVSAWLMNATQHQGESKGKGVAVDGKVLRRSFGSDGKQQQLLSALLHEEKIVVSQRQIQEKHNEITEFKNLLRPLDIEGLTVTADALHCQIDHADFLVKEKNADFLFAVKENQPTLEKLVKDAFDDNERPFTSEAILTSNAHGRIDTRSASVKKWTHDLANQHAFPFIAQILRIERQWTDLKGNNPKGETRFFITSSGEAADTLMQIATNHWAIETSSHYVRDETLGEDRSRIRTGQAPFVMATLRNLSIGIIRLSGETNIASGIRHFAWNNKTRALKAIGV